MELPANSQIITNSTLSFPKRIKSIQPSYPQITFTLHLRPAVSKLEGQTNLSNKNNEITTRRDPHKRRQIPDLILYNVRIGPCWRSAQARKRRAEEEDQNVRGIPNPETWGRGDR